MVDVMIDLLSYTGVIDMQYGGNYVDVNIFSLGNF